MLVVPADFYISASTELLASVQICVIHNCYSALDHVQDW